MEAPKKIISKSVPGNDHDLRTLPANPRITYSGSPEPNVSNRDESDERGLALDGTTGPASDSVPKPVGNVGTSLPKLVAVKELARLYGLTIGAIYTFIRTEPDFPYINIGVKKKFLVDVAQFEMWLADRTKRQKHEHFAIPSAVDLMNAFKNKNFGGNK